MAYKLSPSALGLFKDCPECFWLEKKKGIKRPEGIFPSLPSGVDKVLKTHFDSFRSRGELPPELKELPQSVKLFPDIELLKVWRNNFKGISFKDKEGNELHGAVDELLVKDGKLIVLDFKTRGFPLKEDTAELYRNQLDIYNFLLRKNNHAAEDYSYLLFFHPKGISEKGDLLLNIDLIKMDVDVKVAEKLWQDALKTLEGDKEPKASEECGFCNWSRVK